MLDLSTKAGALAYAERTRKGVVQCWEKFGRFEANGFSYGASLFITHEPPSPTSIRRAALGIGQHALFDVSPGPKLARVEAMPVKLPTWMRSLPGHETTAGHLQERELFATALRAFAKMTRAIGVIWMGETWLVDMPAPPPGKTHEQVRDELPADLGEAKGRREALVVRLEHQAIPQGLMWCAEILRSPARVEPWRDFGMGDAFGRMVDFVDWRS